MPIIEKYQPKAVLFQGPARAKNLLRWCGNEGGSAQYPCWGSTNDLSAEGGVRKLCWGKSIGHKRIETCKPTAVKALTFRVHKAANTPTFAFTAYRT